MEFLSTSTNILLIIIGFGLLIFIHELGHFIAAKWARIRTEGFAIGFGPILCSFRFGVGFRFGSTQAEVVRRLGRPAIECSSEELTAAGVGETEYTLRLLPLGGFVRMLGQDDIDPGATSADPKSFNSKPIGKRMVVVSAGIIMNLILAIVLFLAAFLVGVKFNAPIIGMVEHGKPAARSGVQPGDQVVAIDGDKTRTFADVQIAFAMSSPGTTLEMELLDPNTRKTRTVEVLPEKNPMTGLLGIGVTPGSSSTLTFDPNLNSIIESAVVSAGLGGSPIGPGWRIDKAGEVPITTWDQWAAVVNEAKGSAVEVNWIGPDGTSATKPMKAEPLLEILPYPEQMPTTVPNYEQGLIGLTPLVRINSIDPSSLNKDALDPGDVVLRVKDVDGPRSAIFRQIVQESAGKKLDMLVLRDGKIVSVEASVNGSGQLGVIIGPALETPMTARPFLRVGNIEVDGPAIDTPVANLGLLPLTRITGVNSKPVTDWDMLRSQLRTATQTAAEEKKGATITLDIENPTPGRERQEVQVTLDDVQVAELHALGWSPPIQNVYFDPLWTTLSANGNPLTAIGMGFQETEKMVILTYLTIIRLAQGSVGVEQLRGPVGIVHLGSRVADRGFMYLIFFLAMISVNLAVLNFLPLPIVDGGLFLYLVYEKFKGRPPSIGFQNAAALVGLLLIGTIFIVTFYNDVMRLAGGG